MNYLDPNIYLYISGVTTYLRKYVKSDITEDEAGIIMRMIDFPIKSESYTKKDGSNGIRGRYHKGKLLSILGDKDRVSKMRDQIMMRREQKDKMESDKLKNDIRHDNRTQDEIEAEEIEKRKEIMRKRIEDEDMKDRENPEENMEKVSNELLKQDGAYND